LAGIVDMHRVRPHRHLVISLPDTPYRHRVYEWFWPTLCTRLLLLHAVGYQESGWEEARLIGIVTSWSDRIYMFLANSIYMFLANPTY
jgi:hypothetical protein